VIPKRAWSDNLASQGVVSRYGECAARGDDVDSEMWSGDDQDGGRCPRVRDVTNVRQPPLSEKGAECIVLCVSGGCVWVETVSGVVVREIVLP
jgi:hypothetical protein